MIAYQGHHRMRKRTAKFAAAALLAMLGGCMTTADPAPESSNATTSQTSWNWPATSVFANDPGNAEAAMAEYQIVNLMRQGKTDNRKICVNTAGGVREIKPLNPDVYAKLKQRYEFLRPLNECMRYQVSNKVYFPKDDSIVIAVHNIRCFVDVDYAGDSKIRFGAANPGWTEYILTFRKDEPRQWAIDIYERIPLGDDY